MRRLHESGLTVGGMFGITFPMRIANRVWRITAFPRLLLKENGRTMPAETITDAITATAQILDDDDVRVRRSRVAKVIRAARAASKESPVERTDIAVMPRFPSELLRAPQIPPESQ